MEFRAIGQEPGWSLEINESGRVDFVTDYGGRSYAFDDAERMPESGRALTTYRARSAGHALEVVVEDRPCSDTMSGEAFEATVTIRLDDEEYRGCGRVP